MHEMFLRSEKHLNLFKCFGLKNYPNHFTSKGILSQNSCEYYQQLQCFLLIKFYGHLFESIYLSIILGRTSHISRLNYVLSSVNSQKSENWFMHEMFLRSEKHLNLFKCFGLKNYPNHFTSKGILSQNSCEYYQQLQCFLLIKFMVICLRVFTYNPR